MHNIAILLSHNYPAFDKPFFLSVMDLFGKFYDWQRATGRRDNLSFICQDGYDLAEMRNSVTETALDDRYGIDLVLYLDTDMSFPGNMIQLMIEDIEDNEGVEAVTGLYTWKKPPYMPHIYPELKDNKFGMAKNFDLDTVFPVVGSGMGCVMVKTEAIKRMSKPYFSFHKGMGEDFYFFKKLKPKMLCDTRIKCKHYGLMGVDIYDYARYNNIKIEKIDRINPTDQKADEIVAVHSKLNNI